MSTSLKLLLVFIVTNTFFSCSTKKDILYFQNSEQKNYQQAIRIDKNINIDDILSVKIYSLDIESSAPYNLASITDVGYLVDNSGKITLPVLGLITVIDKSTEELELFLTNKLITQGHLKNPTVVVRLLNSKITVLGEVNTPGTYNFTEKNITLLQVIGLAGDLTINGRRNDIMLIRQENDEKKIIHIDLTSTDWFSSPYYYIKPNDVIIVNPNEAKIKSAGLISSPSALLSIVSILLTSFLLIKF